jgi:hypothetical protein
MTTHSWQRFYADLFGLDLRNFAPFWAYPPDQAIRCTLDWGYTPSLYLNGYASLSTIPSYATDLEFDVEAFFHTRYVSEDKNKKGIVYPRIRPATCLQAGLNDNQDAAAGEGTAETVCGRSLRRSKSTSAV